MSDSDDNNFDYSYEDQDDEFESRSNLRQVTSGEEGESSKTKRQTRYGGAAAKKQHPNRDYYLFQQTRTELQEAYDKWVQQFNQYTTDFKQNNPRTTNFFFDCVDYSGRLGSETPFGFPRKVWLNVGFFFNLVTFIFLTVAALGLSPRSPTGTRMINWVYNNNYDGGVWVMPSGYVTFAPSEFEPSSEATSEEELEKSEVGEEEDMALKKKRMKRKRMRAKRHQPQNDDNYGKGNDQSESWDDSRSYGREGNGRGKQYDDEFDDYYYYFDDDIYFDDETLKSKVDKEDDWGDVGGFIGAEGSVARASLSLTSVTWATCSSSKPKDTVPVYMYSSGFIGPSARSLAPVWSNVCTRCHIDQVVALICAAFAYLCFIPELYCFYQRKKEDFFHPEEKLVGMLVSFFGTAAICFMMVVPTNGCINQILKTDIGKGAIMIGPGAAFGWLGLFMKLLCLFIHILLIEDHEMLEGEGENMEASETRKIRCNIYEYCLNVSSIARGGKKVSNDDDGLNGDFEDDFSINSSKKYVPKSRRPSNRNNIRDSIKLGKSTGDGKGKYVKIHPRKKAQEIDHDEEEDDVEVGRLDDRFGGKDDEIEYEEVVEWVEEMVMEDGEEYLEEYETEEAYQSEEEVEVEVIEKRYDEGKEFTYDEFIDFYGDEDGNMEWESSEVVPQDKFKKVLVDKVRTVTKKRLVKKPPKEVKKLVKKVTKIPKTKLKDSPRSTNKKAAKASSSFMKYRSYSDEEDEDDVRSHGGRSSVSSQASHRSKLDGWLGKSSQYMYPSSSSKETRPSSPTGSHKSLPSQQRGRSGHSRSSSLSSLRMSRSVGHHYGGEDSEHSLAREEVTRQRYVEQMKRDPDAMLATRRVQTDSGVWRTEARDPQTGHWVVDDRDFRIRLSKQFRSSDGTYHDTLPKKTTSYSASQKKFFHDTLNESMGEDAYLYNAYGNGLSTPTGDNSYKSSKFLDQERRNELLKSKEKFDLLSSKFHHTTASSSPRGSPTKHSGVTWGEEVREEVETFEKPFKSRRAHSASPGLGRAPPRSRSSSPRPIEECLPMFNGSPLKRGRGSSDGGGGYSPRSLKSGLSPEMMKSISKDRTYLPTSENSSTSFSKPHQHVFNRSNSSNSNHLYQHKDLSADEQLSKMCEGLSEKDAKNLKSAWMKILNFLQKDPDMSMKLVKQFKSAEADEAIQNIGKHGNNYEHTNVGSGGSGVPIRRLLNTLDAMGAGLTVSEGYVWLARQDINGDGIITLNELSIAIAVAANIRSAQSNEDYKRLLEQRREERAAEAGVRDNLISKYG